MLKRYLPAMALTVLAVPLLAQTATVPDLSGTWVLDAAKSKLPAYVHIGSQKIAITCSGKAIRLQFTTDRRKSTVTYIPDGKDHSQLGLDGETHSKVQWKDSVLTVESSVNQLENEPTSGGPGQYSGRQMPSSPGYNNYQPMVAGASPTKQELWSLSPDGRVLTRVWVGYNRPGTNVFSNLIFVYDKQ